MSTPHPSGSAVAGSTRIVTRETLRAAWALFQVCVPTCLPLAIIGVAASATPGAEAASAGGTSGVLHDREWWGVLAASTVLTLICYGGVLRQQLALTAGERPQLFESLRHAARDVPYVLVLCLLSVLPFAPAVVSTALRGFDAIAAALTGAAIAICVYAVPAWPALIARRLTPWAALRSAIGQVRGRWREFAGVIGVVLVFGLVFVLLAGILIGMLMGLAGQDTPTAGGLAFSRWLIALVLAVPVVYAAAVAVVLFRAGQPR